MLKTCTKCGETKQLDSFYKVISYKDKRQSWCKECHNSQIRESRKANVEKFRAKDRERGKLPHRKKSRRKASLLWRKKNSLQHKAGQAFRNYLRDKHIERPVDCSLCGTKGKIEGHHEDYTKPLAVIWLCPKCHGTAHCT